MSQEIFNNINPETTSGLMLAGLLDDFKDAIMSGFSGLSRPTNLQAGGMWIDTSQQSSPNFIWSLKLYTGSADITLFRISVLSGSIGAAQALSSFTVKHVAADTAGAILNLVKQRTLSSGQVLAGDTIAELRMTGCDDTGGAPIVGYIRVTASDNEKSGTQGVTMSMFSSPVGTGTLIEHLRFLNGCVESVVAHKVNSRIIGADSLASTADIVLTVATMLTELTGSVASTIHGCALVDVKAKKLLQDLTYTSVLIGALGNAITVTYTSGGTAGSEIVSVVGTAISIQIQSGVSTATQVLAAINASAPALALVSAAITGTAGNGQVTASIVSLTGGVINQSQVKILHNRTTQPITIKSGSGFTTSQQQFSLPNGDDLVIRPQGSIAFFYCTTDTKWKYLFGKTSGILQSIYNLVEGYTEWVAPFTGYIRVSSFTGPSTEPTGSGLSSALSRASLKTVLGMGKNDRGQLGFGDASDHSTPVPLAFNPQFKLFDVGVLNGFAQREDGPIYAWGSNDHGQIGLNGTTGVDSLVPTVVISGIEASFTRVELSESAFAQDYSGILYAWGRNQFGQLGAGDVVSRSFPVAVLGGIKFAAVFHGAEGEGSVFGIERDTGSLYAWGRNNSGQLGVGDLADRSSPVAVLSGLKFSKVAVGTGAIVALDKSGVPYSWGKNPDGELGIGSVFTRSSPVAVAGGLIFADLSVIPGANNSFYGLTQEGKLYAWGSNANGELGLGDTTPRSSPVAVAGGLSIDFLARLNSGTRSVLAVQAGTGAAYAWGSNANGQLGDGTSASKSSPVAVAGGHTFSRLTLGSGFVTGEASDGRVYAWGKNTNGQLGDGTTVTKSSPVAVMGFTEPFFEIPILKNIPVTKGTTYKIKIGGGASFFGDTIIGKNIRRATIAYEK